MAGEAGEYGGLSESGSHGGRGGYRRTFGQDDGVSKSAWSLFYWRSGGRHGTAGRFQLSVGMGVRILCRTSCIDLRNASPGGVLEFCTFLQERHTGKDFRGLLQ